MTWQPTEEGRELLIRVLQREKDEGFQALMDNFSMLLKNVDELAIATKEIAIRLVKLEKKQDE